MLPFLKQRLAFVSYKHLVTLALAKEEEEEKEEEEGGCET